MTGALGHGDLDYSTKLQGRVAAPTLIESSYVSRTKFIDVACGEAHTVILSGLYFKYCFNRRNINYDFKKIEKGEVCCCGQGSEGQLGYGGKQEHFFPRRVDIEEESEFHEEDDEQEINRNGPIGKLLRSVRVFCGPKSTSIITGDSYTFLETMEKSFNLFKWKYS